MRNQQKQRTHSNSSDSARTTQLAGAIRRATADRGTFTIQDGIQAGLTEAEVRRLYDAALVEARAAEPALADRAAA